MSERGYFFLDRGIWDHPLFAREAFTEREAWLWMISAAAWKGMRVRAGRKIVDLKRGQLVFSERFMATKWRWSKTSVRRFIERLKSEAMVSALADRDATLITICNYDKYQLPRTTEGPQSGPLKDHSRTKEEEINTLKDAAASPTAPNPEAELFRRGREVLGKQAGGLISQLLNAKQKNVALARAAIEQASTKDKPREYIGAVIRGPKSSPNEPNWLDGIPGVI